MSRLRVVGFFLILVCLIAAGRSALGESLAPVPKAIASEHFTVTIDGQTTAVFHAAVNLYFLNFDGGKHRKISVSALTEDFWAKGVEVQPWRYGIRPVRKGRTISFSLDGPAKITISRPGDHGGDAEMLYLFANAPEAVPSLKQRRGMRYYGPGVHTENIDAASGDSIYLAAGAVVFGALNIWGVDHVKVFGRGVIVYDGPQNPKSDDGWMHKRNWHCIVMDTAHAITIEGITCVVRSRTWQIQMKDSRNVVFDNVKVIGANTGNANADGMDWLGGGDTVVKDSFFRAADDVFAMYTSWEGYGPKAFAVQGAPVTNIRVEKNVLSTSISNIVRVGWPEKNMEGGNFQMEDTDVLHMGEGGCGVPFALMEAWADPSGRGKSAGFHFKDIRLEDWYSLTQLRQQGASVSDVSFTDVAALEQPALLPSVLSGNVSAVRFDNVTAGGEAANREAELPLDRVEDVGPVSVSATGPRVHIEYNTGLVRPGLPVHFKAVVDGGGSTDLRYAWIFGDGTTGYEAEVTHAFPDTQGTLLDGSGRFRILLHVTDGKNRQSWSYQPVVVAEALLPAEEAAKSAPGLKYTYSETAVGGAAAVVEMKTMAGLKLPEDHRPQDYGYSFDGEIDAPSDGTYTFALIVNDSGEIELDGKRIAQAPKPFANVCGLAGNAAHYVSADVALAKGRHHLRVSEEHKAGHDDFKFLWRVPGGTLAPITGENFVIDSGLGEKND